MSCNDWKRISFLSIWCRDRIGSDLCLLTTSCRVIFSPGTYKSFSQKKVKKAVKWRNWYTIFKRYTECNQLTCVALGPLLNPNSWSSIRPTVVVFTDFFLHMVLPPWCLQSSSCRESRSFLWRMIEKSITIKQFLIDQIIILQNSIKTCIAIEYLLIYSSV